MKKSKTYYYVGFILAVFFWSANFVVARDLLISGVNYNLLSLVRTVVAILFFAAVIVIRRRPVRLIDLKKNFIWLFGMGFIGVTVFYILSNVGLQYVDAGRSSLINSINPALIVLFGAWLFKEPLTKRRVAGVVVSFIGVLVVIFAKNEGLLYQLNFNPVDILFLGTGLCVTFYTVFNRYLGDNIDYAVGLFWTFMIGAVALIPLGVPYLPEIAELTSFQWLEIIAIGVICGGACNLFFYEALMVLGMGSCGIINSFSPLFSVIIAWLFLDESLTPVLVGGALILTLGVWLGVGGLPASKQTGKDEEQDSFRASSE